MVTISSNNVILIVSVGKLVVDLIILIICYLIPSSIIKYGSVVQRGFFCNDESIRYPYIPSPIINSLYIFVGETVIVGIVILISELYHYFKINQKFKIGNLKLPIYVWKIYTSETAFLFGLLCTRLSILFWKYQVGRLRPHFYDACIPSVDCSDPKNVLQYHIKFNCTNPLYNHSEFEFREMRTSFPSGQVAYSIYCMLYLIIYLENKMIWKGSTFFKQAIQFAAFNISMYIGFANIIEYYHYPSDVLAGLSLGSVFAVITAVYTGRLYLNPKQQFKTEYEELL